MTLPLREAHEVLCAAIAAAGRLGCCETVVVVDETGDRVVFARMDGAWADAVDLAFAKAFAAYAFGQDTAALAVEGHPARRMFDSPSPEWGIYAGGMPLRRGAAVIGAVGVAGGDASQDSACARAAAGAWAHVD